MVFRGGRRGKTKHLPDNCTLRTAPGLESLPTKLTLDMIFFVFAKENLNSTVQFGLSSYPKLCLYTYYSRIAVTVLNLLLQVSFLGFIWHKSKKYIRLAIIPSTCAFQCGISLITEFTVTSGTSKMLLILSMLTEASTDLLVATIILAIPFVPRLARQDR